MGAGVLIYMPIRWWNRRIQPIMSMPRHFDARAYVACQYISTYCKLEARRVEVAGNELNSARDAEVA